MQISDSLVRDSDTANTSSHLMGWLSESLFIVLAEESHEDAAQAHRIIEGKKSVGKVILTVSEWQAVLQPTYRVCNSRSWMVYDFTGRHRETYYSNRVNCDKRMHEFSAYKRMILVYLYELDGYGSDAGPRTRW